MMHHVGAGVFLNDVLSFGNNDIDNKVKEAFYIKKQKPLLNIHLHQHGALFLFNVF